MIQRQGVQKFVVIAGHASDGSMGFVAIDHEQIALPHFLILATLASNSS
jgi:hypothetical protein